MSFFKTRPRPPGRGRGGALALLAAAWFVLGAPTAIAAPYTPKSDSEVVERLPASASDPSLRRVDALRKQLAARPDDVGLRLEIGRRYFEMAMAQGDPRYVGYASAAIGPLAQSAAANADYWSVRGMIEQYSHDFAGALQSLAKAEELNPKMPEPLAWEAAIYMVQARYAEALSRCTRLVPLAHPLFAQGCTAYVEASTGHLADAYRGLQKELAEAGAVAPELTLWIRTRLAEMAVRLRRTDEAQAHFNEALKLGVTDQFLLGAYSDFLLLQQRPAEVMKLLADWERSDVLLLRLALAGKAAKDPRAAGWADQLRDRFAAANLRGDRLHEQEAARFELDVEGHPGKALELAARNYQAQKEARDAEILLRAALAAKQAKAAQPALDWLRSTKYEDPALAALADQLAAQGARR
jgi:tetratricopeptide (TPR) repeat protein